MGTVTYFSNLLQAKKDLGHRIVCSEALLDFAVNPVCAGDVVQGPIIPANSKVMEVHTTVKTAEGATCTATVGDADGSDSWDAAVDLNAAAATSLRSLPGTDAYATAGKFYAAEDTIDLTMGHETDAAAMIVTAVYQTLEQYA